MIIDIMSQKKKAKKDMFYARQLNKIGREIEIAEERFNAAVEPLDIEAAIFKLNELETLRKSLIVKAKLQKIEI